MCCNLNVSYSSTNFLPVTDDAKRLLEVFGVDRTLTTWMTPSMMQYTLFSEFGAFGFFTYEIEGAMVGNTKRNILHVILILEESNVKLNEPFSHIIRKNRCISFQAVQQLAMFINLVTNDVPCTIYIFPFS